MNIKSHIPPPSVITFDLMDVTLEELTKIRDLLGDTPGTYQFYMAVDNAVEAAGGPEYNHKYDVTVR